MMISTAGRSNNTVAATPRRGAGWRGAGWRGVGWRGVGWRGAGWGGVARAARVAGRLALAV
ncbi:hypothetical protein [Rhizocola hellebori]|uniref:hypothetical protein n=1 Tax=Rhizocola hellebori TaxID=1392758 RepID=UPI00194349CE|nr:hypothetical protein [Rhizocola hellebori]